MNKYLCILLGIVSFANNLFAQSNDTLRTDEIYIFREYEPTVSDAFKISSFPSIQDKAIEAPEIKYSLIKKQVATSFNVEPIKAARMKGDALDKLSKAYMKAGIGNYTNNLFEFYLNNSRSRTHSVGLHLKHFGSGGGINDVGYNGFSKQGAVVYGKKFLRQHLIESNLNYGRDVVRYYGYSTNSIEDNTIYSELDKDNTKQRFSQIGANGRVKSFYKDSTKTNYNIDLNYYNLTDKYGSMENYGIVSAQFVKMFNPEWSEFMNNEVITLDVSLDYNNYAWADSSFMHNATAGNYSNGIFRLTPQIVSSGKKWRLDFGGNMNVDADNTAKFHFYPKVEFKYNVLKDMLIPYVGWNGEMQRNNFGSFSDENPFVRSEITLANTNKYFDFYGGVRGAFSSRVGFNFKASRSELRKMPLFVNHDTIGLTFNVVYDTVMITDIGGEISFQQAEKLNLVFKGNYYIYQLKNEVAPWHLPNLRIGMTGFYDLKDKIVVRADIFYVSGQTVRSFNPADEDLGSSIFKKDLKGYFDASLGVEYRYTKKLSAFLNINNLTSTKYYKWNNYPSQSINVLGGFTYSFWE